MNWLADNWLTLATFFVSLIATIVVTHIYAMKGKATRKLRCKLNSLNAISAKVAQFPGLTVRYAGHGEALETFTITQVLIWNVGTEVIRKQEVASAEPLAIAVKDGCKVLDYTLVKTNNSASQIELSRNKEKTKVRVAFDHLNLGLSDSPHPWYDQNRRGNPRTLIHDNNPNRPTPAARVSRSGCFSVRCRHSLANRWPS